ncbi:ABC transporter ATP-binding protein [Falsirhodobacter sp. 20TX0035]|uniref:ABC transporter ATP-binding protein n=1 Tax=Falsirhodobacter sp. 20TX0035 TaxID=3022019 RepID=UPI00232E23B0|nr:ABC transporter ATP-binding protein [Falsirhodobacter sp. 20TX0035]MDB6453542.1 ABC transporter ATP-binding protein [Falsirhodobacter sp. 20TX0035]
MAVAFLLMMIEGSTLGALSWMIKPLFDKVFTPEGAGALVWVGVGIFGLFAVRATTSILSKVVMTRISQKSSTAMQADLLRHMLTLDQDFFQVNSPGQLIERVQGDTSAVQGVWSSVIAGLGRDTISLIGLFVVALNIDVHWTLAAMIGAPLLILPAIVVQRYIRKKVNQSRAQAGLRATRLDEIFHGIQAIKLNRMENYQLGRFRAIVGKLVRNGIKTAAGRAAMPALVDLITGLGFFAVLMLAGNEIVAGERTVGEFMSFFTAMALTFQPMRRLGDLSGFWQVAAASLTRIFRLFDLQPTPRPAPTAVPKGTPPQIELRDVHFAYTDMPVLNGASFTAKAGKMTALVGASGAGKSTVFHLLTGLAQPVSGQILMDGVDISRFSLDDLRGQFAVVSQDSALFDETIRENVVLGRKIPEDKLHAALDAAHVTEFVRNLPAGVESPAGPRGSALSGGQRQRVAIARALISGTPVLLMDEATSALDAQSEAVVASALAQQSHGRTMLVIAHRLSTIREADSIVVMDQGRVVDQGTHDDLLRRGGIYADLYRLQFKDQT